MLLKIRNVEFLTSANKIENYPIYDFPEVVLLGRSNVGKSSFINAFVNNKKIAYTSQTPGKTQLLNFFRINNEFVIVDVPGYGYARVSKKRRAEFGQMIEEYLKTRINISFVALLIDFKVGPTEDDILMYNYLQYYKLDTLVIATKKDKVKKNEIGKNISNILKKLDGLSIDNLCVYSSKDRNTLIPVFTEFKKKLELNSKEL